MLGGRLTEPLVLRGIIMKIFKSVRPLSQARRHKQTSTKPPGYGGNFNFVCTKTPKITDILLLLFLMGILSFSMISCSQPAGSTAPSVPESTPANPTNPTIDIENSPIVQGIRDLGFKVSCVDVAPVEGLYTPETGDLVDLKFLHHNGSRMYNVHMQLDRENSTKDNLVYKGTYIDEKANEEYNIEDMIGKMKFDKENHAIQYYDDEGPFMNMRIKLNEDNRPEFIFNGFESNYHDISMEVVEGVVYKPPGIELFKGFDVQLAK